MALQGRPWLLGEPQAPVTAVADSTRPLAEGPDRFRGEAYPIRSPSGAGPLRRPVRRPWRWAAACPGPNRWIIGAALGRPVAGARLAAWPDVSHACRFAAVADVSGRIAILSARFVRLRQGIPGSPRQLARGAMLIWMRPWRCPGPVGRIGSADIGKSGQTGPRNAIEGQTWPSFAGRCVIATPPGGLCTGPGADCAQTRSPKVFVPTRRTGWARGMLH